MRQQALFPGWARPTTADAAAADPASPARRRWTTNLARWAAPRGRRLLTRAGLGLALALLAAAGALMLLRGTHDGRVYPAVYVAGQSLGGLTRDQARAAIRERAAAVERGSVTFSHEGREWSAPMGDLGVGVDPDAALEAAFGVGREADAAARLGTTADLVRGDRQFPLPLSLDRPRLDRWFATIDGELGKPPREASLAIDGASVSVVPEVDGTVVDREAATATLVGALRGLRPVDAPLPTVAQSARVRAGDLTAARDTLARALSESIQVTFGDAYWTLSPAQLGQFVDQRVDPKKRGAEAFSLGLDEARLAAWLEETLAPQIDREPVDAEVGWNWEAGGLVSVEPSVDGARLEPKPLAKSVAESFFGDHGLVPASVTITKPQIDSANLDKLGVATLLGVGTSNYVGSDAGRATNVERGASLLNGTLVPPGGTFSFNNAIGVINEANGYVEAQVIDGESIGKDIGGGICQVSTTVFRAAYMAGLQMDQWHPHRFRIPFYEADGWAPGLDASILQPTEDPETWGDFSFINPSDSWMLVESWSTGANVVVNLYGADLGFVVETEGPIFGQPTQVLPDQEIVDPELELGTINLTQAPLEGVTVEHYRRVMDRDRNVLREGSFKTTYSPRGNVWKVSPDMKGKSDADPDRPLPKPKPPPTDEGAMQDAAAGAATVDGVSVVEEPIPAEQPAPIETAAAEPVYEEAAPVVEATIAEEPVYEEPIVEEPVPAAAVDEPVIVDDES